MSITTDLNSHSPAVVAVILLVVTPRVAILQAVVTLRATNRIAKIPVKITIMMKTTEAQSQKLALIPLLIHLRQTPVSIAQVTKAPELRFLWPSFSLLSSPASLSCSFSVPKSKKPSFLKEALFISPLAGALWRVLRSY